MTFETKLLVGLVLAIALFVSGFGIGWHFKGNEDASATLKAQKQQVEQGNAQNAADAKSAQAHEAARTQVEYRDRVVYQQVAVSATDPDYQTCRLKSADLDLLNQAIGGVDVSQRK